jgi:hypothetical protein
MTAALRYIADIPLRERLGPIATRRAEQADANVAVLNVGNSLPVRSGSGALFIKLGSPAAAEWEPAIAAATTVLIPAAVIN